MKNFSFRNESNLAFGRERERERNHALDIAKGICIFLMVIGHSGAPRLLHDAIYMFHMPCFFIISGWLFKEKYLSNVMSFIKRKISTLWKPFVIYGLIYLCISNLFVILHILEPPALTLNDFIEKGTEVVTMQSINKLLGGFWFLTSLLIASIISILWYRLIGKNFVSIFIGIILFLGLAFAVCHYKIITTYFHTYTLMAISYFMTGTLLNRLKIPKSQYTHFTLIILAILVVGVGLFFIMPIEMGTMKDNLIVPYFISSVIISYALIIICFTVVPNSLFKWLATLGRRSIDILIFHFLVFKIVSLLKIWHYGLPIERLSDFPVITTNNHIYWLLYVAVGICCSLLIADVIAAIKNGFVNIFNKKINQPRSNFSK